MTLLPPYNDPSQKKPPHQQSPQPTSNNTYEHADNAIQELCEKETNAFIDVKIANLDSTSNISQNPAEKVQLQQEKLKRQAAYVHIKRHL
jgi:hypothetical protein